MDLEHGVRFNDLALATNKISCFCLREQIFLCLPLITQDGNHLPIAESFAGGSSPLASIQPKKRTPFRFVTNSCYLAGSGEATMTSTYAIRSVAAPAAKSDHCWSTKLAIFAVLTGHGCKEGLSL